MNRAQRKAHARVWLILALALLVTTGIAIAAKERVSGETAHAWTGR